MVEFIVKLHQIKANQTSIQHHNTHAKKKHESEDMIKTEAIKIWSDHVNFTLQNRFSWTFKVLKPMSFRGLPNAPGLLPGALPLDPTRGPKADHWTPGGVLNFELGTDVRPEVSTTTL